MSNEKTVREVMADAEEAYARYRQANLGLASNEELIRELICRFKMMQFIPDSSETATLAIERALVLAEMVGSMDAPTREYRTVDG